MGLGQDRPSRIYINISHGKLRQRSNSNDPEAKPRVIKDDDGSQRTVYERIYQDITGMIEKIEIKDTDYGQQYQILISDAEAKYSVCIGVGGTANKLLNKLGNIDPMRPVRIVPLYFEKDKKSQFLVEQESVVLGDKWDKIPGMFTKDNPGNMPKTTKPWDELTEIQKKKFALAMDEFFMDYTTTVLNPMFETWIGEENIAPLEQPPSLPEQEPPQDDLPFIITILLMVGGFMSQGLFMNLV
jgi:hypothetical protein